MFGIFVALPSLSLLCCSFCEKLFSQSCQLRGHFLKTPMFFSTSAIHVANILPECWRFKQNLRPTCDDENFEGTLEHFVSPAAFSQRSDVQELQKGSQQACQMIGNACSHTILGRLLRESVISHATAGYD